MKYDVVNAQSFIYILNNVIKYPIFINVNYINDNDIFCICVDNNKLVGVLKQSFIYNYNINSNQRTINYISVLDEYRNKGIGKNLIQTYVNYYNMNKFHDCIFFSPYTKNGFKYIRHILINQLEKNLIQYQDSYCFQS